MFRSSRASLPFCLFCIFLLVLGVSGNPRTAQVEAVTTLNFPAGFMPSVTEYGANGNDSLDDTAAIQRALDDNRRDENGESIHDDYYGRPKALYFPPGEYLVSDTLDWIGCCVTLQGAGQQATVIRLVDGAADFGDVNAPKPIIFTPDGNMSFRQNVRDLTIDTGSGNPGALGIDWIANNSGSISDVTIRSGDGAGYAGLDMRRAWPGPCLVKNVNIEGFEYGIIIYHAEYGPTFENITLRNQRQAGIFNSGNTLAIRKLQSENSVPAILSFERWASLIVLDSELNGGAADRSAIEAAGYVYARNLTTSGYSSAIALDGAVVPGLRHNEYISGEVYQLFDGPQHSLSLPIAETPQFHDANMDNWARFEPQHYGDTNGLQELLNAGKSTIYFPFGGYYSYNERAVTVPDSVRRIIGFSSVMNGDDRGENGGSVRFIVEGDSDIPLIVEGFGYGIKIEHRGKRPLVLKYGHYRYTAQPGAGDLYLEDVGIDGVRFQPGQRIWARQFNNESFGPKIVNDSAQLWILGLKTERTGTVIETINGGKTELLGTLIYPAAPFSGEEKQKAAFVSRDAQMSLIYSVSTYCEGCGYDIQIEETRDGETRQILTSAFPGRMPLFAGFPEAAPPGDERVYLPLVLRPGS
jgi:hypothetical protein